MSSRRLPIARAVVAASVALSRAASGQEPVSESVPEAASESAPLPLQFSADQVRFDVRSRSLFVAGRVRVDAPPFYFESGALELKRVSIGAELDGDGKVAFCPCLGTPLAVRFTRATVAPPHDVILRNPVLEAFGIPIAWAPIVWLRSAGRIGLLPPELEWRADDGFFAGGGVHVPWLQGDRVRGIDVRAGGYVDGGVSVDVAERTAATATRLVWDRLHGQDGLTITAHGTTADGDSVAGREINASAAWRLDALRGARALRATTDLDAAARRIDRAAGEAAWRIDGWTLASGVRVLAPRGAGGVDFAVGGPTIAARRAGALAGAGAYDVTVEGGQLDGANARATSFARGEGGSSVATHFGPVGASGLVHAVGDVVDDGSGVEWNGAAQARAALGLPMERPYRSADLADPWVHRTEPRVEAAALAMHVDGRAVLPLGRGVFPLPNGAAWVGAVAWSNTLGRTESRGALESEVAAGAVGTAAVVQPALRARVAAGGEWAAVRIDFARVLGPTNDAGGALIAAARVGAAAGLHATAHVSGLDGVDPVVARALLDPRLEPESGFLATSGWTGGVSAAVPMGSRVTARGGADVDFDAAELVAVSGALDVHDPCGCVVLRASGAHRIGRPGVDVWIDVILLSSP